MSEQRKRKFVDYTMVEDILPGDVCSINELTEFCGYFTMDTEVNNGYGCMHIDNEYIGEDCRDLCMGMCYAFACPIASARVYEYDNGYDGGEDSEDAKADLEIIKELGADIEDFRESEQMVEIHIWPRRQRLMSLRHVLN